MAEKNEPTKIVRFSYDKSYQSRLLRVLFTDPDYTVSAGIRLSPEYFEKRAHRWLAAKILNYAKKYGHGIGQDALRIELDRDTLSGRVPKADKDTYKTIIDRLDTPVKDRSFIQEETHRFIKNQASKTAIFNSVAHLEVGDYDAIDAEFNKVIEIQESLAGGLGHLRARRW